MMLANNGRWKGSGLDIIGPSLRMDKRKAKHIPGVIDFPPQLRQMIVDSEEAFGLSKEELRSLDAIRGLPEGWVLKESVTVHADDPDMERAGYRAVKMQQQHVIYNAAHHCVIVIIVIASSLLKLRVCEYRGANGMYAQHHAAA